MYSDYHVHSQFSFDSDENPENIVKQAMELQMKQICFTDHQDFNWPVSGESPLINFHEYFSTLNQLKEKYKKSIEILTGVELGLMTGNESLCRKLVDTYPFDFVIGSCHVIDGMDPYYSEFWESRNDREAFELYFITLLKSLRNFYQIDTMGHLDYIVRYCPNRDQNYSILDYWDIVEEILRLIISHDIKLEINTANFAKGFDFPNPHTDIIRLYKDLGGTFVSIGSDAHDAAHIGYKFHSVTEIIEKFHLKVYTK